MVELFERVRCSSLLSLNPQHQKPPLCKATHVDGQGSTLPEFECEAKDDGNICNHHLHSTS